MSRLHVLISEPNAGTTIYVPYMWAVLKSWFERHSALRDRVTWLDPLFVTPRLDASLEEALQQRIDVLGLSCYVWNLAVQLRIARRVKERNPDCLVVMGGPEPDLKDPMFLAKHPAVDVIVAQDGEVPFQAILEARARGDAAALRSIPGLYLRGDGDAMAPTLPAERLTAFDHSPYRDQLTRLRRLLEGLDRSDLGAVLETNRGCPYRCSFCDWGSATNSKVRRFELDRVYDDLDVIGQLDAAFVVVADANFGMYRRDVDVAERICATHKAHGAPRSVYFSASKNRADRNVEIARTLHQGNVLPLHYLAIQHTEEEVLAAGERANISPTDQMLAAKELARSGVPLTVQLIQGQPGDTPELWLTCLTRLMEWGIHAELQIYPYVLLPNAPAAQPEYARKWALETRAGLFQTTVDRCPLGANDGLLRFHTLIGTRSYSREDWIELNVLSVVCEALHYCGPTQLIARYLRHSHGIAYRDFYRLLLEDFLPGSPWLRALVGQVRARARSFLDEDAVYGLTSLEDVPDFRFHVTLTQWFFIQLVVHREAFYDALDTFLRARFPAIVRLPRLVAYQRRMLIAPDYDATRGRSFPVADDWPAYFAATWGAFGHERFAEPAEVRARVAISDTRFGACGRSSLAWGGSSAERLLAWLESVAVITNFCSCALFSALELQPAPPPAPPRPRRPEPGDRRARAAWPWEGLPSLGLRRRVRRLLGLPPGSVRGMLRSSLHRLSRLRRQLQGTPLRGPCIFCGVERRFSPPGAAYREGYRCRGCRSSLRERHVATALGEHLAGGRLSRIADLLPLLRGKSVFLAQTSGPLQEALAGLPGAVFSELLPGVAPGASRAGVRCEDLQALSFPDDSLDLVITQDVLEHVRDPDRVWSELRRTLKPGGLHVFSVPCDLDRATVTRVELVAGREVFRHPPVYHGDPIGDGLVYTDFGGDLIDRLEGFGLPTEVHWLRELPEQLPSYVFVSTRG